MDIYSPIEGKLKTLKSLNDGVFSEKIMGDGVIISPKSNTIYAPISGRLVTVFPTGHAYGIEGKDGTNVLVHIGVDTVELNGEGFTSLVKQGKKIKAGKPMAIVDFEKIKNKVPSIDVIVIVTIDSKTTIDSLVSKGEVTTDSLIIKTS